MTTLAWPLAVNTYTWSRGFSSGGHLGIDLACSTGTPVYAAAAGTVSATVTVCSVGDQGCGGGWGNHLDIDHGGGIKTKYAHLTTVSVALNATVTKGQLIGYSGTTGHSTGPHLHFEVWENGVRVNPMAFLPANNTTAGGNKGFWDTVVNGGSGSSSSGGFSSSADALAGAPQTPLGESERRSFFGGGVWGIGRQLLRNIESNLPFAEQHNRMGGTHFGGPKLQKGRLQVIRDDLTDMGPSPLPATTSTSSVEAASDQLTNATNNAVGGLGDATPVKTLTQFHFLYNPTEIDFQFGFDPTVLQAAADMSESDRASLSLLTNISISWSLYLDRRFEVQDGTRPEGILFDLYVLERLMGVEKSGGAVAPSIIEARFGPYFSATGFMNQLNVQMVEFSPRMVPTVARLDLGLMGMFGTRPDWATVNTPLNGTGLPDFTDAPINQNPADSVQGAASVSTSAQKVYLP